MTSIRSITSALRQGASRNPRLAAGIIAVFALEASLLVAMLPAGPPLTDTSTISRLAEANQLSALRLTGQTLIATERSGEMLRVEGVSEAAFWSIADEVKTGPFMAGADPDPFGEWLTGTFRNPLLGVLVLLATPAFIVLRFVRPIWRERRLAILVALGGAVIGIEATQDAAWIQSPWMWVAIVVVLPVVSVSLLRLRLAARSPSSSHAILRAGVVAASFAVGFIPAMLPAFFRAAGIVGLRL